VGGLTDVRVCFFARDWKDRSVAAVTLDAMRIAVSGSSGLIGSALVPSLSATGHEVVRLVRSATEGTTNESVWNPARGEIDSAVIDDADAVINLNGRSLADGRWSRAVKEDLRSSRLDSTRTLANAITSSKSPPGILISASAVGFYGDRGEETLDESSPKGQDFLANLSGDWEEAALAAVSPATRVALLRTGMVVAHGGAVGRMLTPFKLGLGGPIGSGRQFWPWVGIEDVCGVVEFILNHDIRGPVNVVAPQGLRCSEFARTLGRALSRPAVIPVPAFAVRLLFGEMADIVLLASQRVRPKVLEQAGYEFRAPTLDDALRAALKDR
jgi:uncharacterized protein (TIGR01777 family)